MCPALGRHYHLHNPFAVAGLSKVNKSLGKPIYDNSLNENILQNVSFEILFADAYQAFKDKDFNTALDRITEFERITNEYVKSVNTGVSAIVVHPDLEGRMGALKNFI